MRLHDLVLDHPIWQNQQFWQESFFLQLQQRLEHGEQACGANGSNGDSAAAAEPTSNALVCLTRIVSMMKAFGLDLDVATAFILQVLCASSC